MPLALIVGVLLPLARCPLMSNNSGSRMLALGKRYILVVSPLISLEVIAVKVLQVQNFLTLILTLLINIHYYLVYSKHNSNKTLNMERF